MSINQGSLITATNVNNHINYINEALEEHKNDANAHANISITPSLELMKMILNPAQYFRIGTKAIYTTGSSNGTYTNTFSTPRDWVAFKNNTWDSQAWVCVRGGSSINPYTSQINNTPCSLSEDGLTVTTKCNSGNTTVSIFECTPKF